MERISLRSESTFNSYYSSTIIDVDDVKEWNRYILQSYQYDFYHVNSFHKLESTGKPVLFVVEDSSTGCYIALPFIIRDIPNSDSVDCASAYGFPGPVSSVEMSKLSDHFVDYFKNTLLAFLHQINAVSLVIRLHPIINQEKVTSSLGDRIFVNDTVAIDLRLPQDQQLLQYRDSMRQKVKQMRKKGEFSLRLAQNDQEIDAFIDIYNETMTRVSASDYYFFPNEYFYKILNAPCYRAYLLLAISGSEIAAGALLTVTRDIMQAHLVATSSKFMKEAPMKLLFDEARIFGNSLGVSYLHLGGGYAGQGNDSLFFFKSSFSKLTFKFNLWTLVVDKEKYDSLVEQNRAARMLRENYFPLYRG